MFIIVYLLCFFIFLAWLTYERHKSQRKEEEATMAFWAREEEANRTRKKDISNLPLIKISESEIPLAASTEEIERSLDKIRTNLQTPMIDLSKYSNTDLKLAYGVGNFKQLSDYDENFNSFLINLSNLARIYTQNELFEEAGQTYELAFRCGSQKRSDYVELAQLYLKEDNPSKVTQLIKSVENGNHPHKNSIVQNLRETLATYQ